MAKTSTCEREGQERTLSFDGKPSEFVSPSMIAEAIRRGWQITPERKKNYFAALDTAIANLPKIRDTAKRSTIATQCARVLVAEQAQALRDVHHTETMRHEDGILDLRHRRADEGKPETIVGVQVSPAESLPEPDWLAKRRKLLEPGAS